MSTVALVFWIFAIVLAVFGVAFMLLGENSERGYWAQRDPSGDARSEATKIGAIARKPMHFAAGEYRAPLRIIGIGWLMVYLAVAFAILAVIATVAK